MSVGVGSLHDGDVEGLAHFCEHMLFLGTEKYPDEQAYSKYLNVRRGRGRVEGSGREGLKGIHNRNVTCLPVCEVLTDFVFLKTSPDSKTAGIRMPTPTWTTLVTSSPSSRGSWKVRTRSCHAQGPGSDSSPLPGTGLGPV